MVVKSAKSQWLAFIVCVLFLLWGAAPVQATESDDTENITVIQCEDISVPGLVDVEFSYDGKMLKMVGYSSDNQPRTIAEVKPQKEVVGEVFDYDCEGNTVSITERWAFRALLITQVYKWNGKRLLQTKTTISDPSEDRLEAALQEALNGNLESAKSHFEGVMYPSHYLGCGAVTSFLRKGSQKVPSIQKTKGFEKAALSLENVFELSVEACKESQTSESDPALPIPDRWLQMYKACEVNPGEYLLALNNYGYFLQESGRNKDAVTVLKAVVHEAPNRTVTYLNLADALWGLGNQQESRAAMNEYVRLMTVAGKANKIPKRVQERIKTHK